MVSFSEDKVQQCKKCVKGGKYMRYGELEDQATGMETET